MHWFRSQRGLTWLALFALAGQLTLSFGHVHLGKLGLGLSSAGNGIATVFASAPQKGTAGGDDVCAICASISLANKLVAPADPAFVPPDPDSSDLPWSLAAVAPGLCDHVLFDARGPPHA
jgi:hypothetical protein